MFTYILPPANTPSITIISAQGPRMGTVMALRQQRRRRGIFVESPAK
ncbi:MAG: hypothetical protein KGJ60_11240 [Verrucomicrobiota bacterium]|nr:hypothetical protein [Verrucomicrobiota bacterium]